MSNDQRDQATRALRSLLGQQAFDEMPDDSKSSLLESYAAFLDHCDQMATDDSAERSDESNSYDGIPFGLEQAISAVLDADGGDELRSRVTRAMVKAAQDGYSQIRQTATNTLEAMGAPTLGVVAGMSILDDVAAAQFVHQAAWDTILRLTRLDVDSAPEGHRPLAELIDRLLKKGELSDEDRVALAELALKVAITDIFGLADLGLQQRIDQSWHDLRSDLDDSLGSGAE